MGRERSGDGEAGYLADVRDRRLANLLRVPDVAVDDLFERQLLS